MLVVWKLDRLGRAGSQRKGGRRTVNGLSASLYENFVQRCASFASLLFADLAVLAAIGLAVPIGDDPVGGPCC